MFLFTFVLLLFFYHVIFIVVIDFAVRAKCKMNIEQGGLVMLSIGEFSNICKVSTKTLRYYAKIGLLFPTEVNPENGYRYYSIGQLQKMLLINRLKSYGLSLDEIKTVIDDYDNQDEKLYLLLNQTSAKLEQQIIDSQTTLSKLNNDIAIIKDGKSIMSYLDNIEVQVVDVERMYLVSVRKHVPQHELPQEYSKCYAEILKIINQYKLTIVKQPMVLFHSAEFSSLGIDIEFAIPVKEASSNTREFNPGQCLKTILYGSYSNISSVYTKQREYAELNNFESSDAVYEIYVTDPSDTINESELVTEIYYPIRVK